MTWQIDWIDAICAVLAEKGMPMHYEKITKRILKRGYRTDPDLVHAKSEVNSILSKNAKLNNKFNKLGRGFYGLIDPSASASHSHVGTVVAGLVSVVVWPCTSYERSDSEYKCVSKFVGPEDLKKLSNLEKNLLELIVNFRLPLVNEDVCLADIMKDLEVKILDKEEPSCMLVDAAIFRKKLKELKKYIAYIERWLQENPLLQENSQYKHLRNRLNNMRSAVKKIEDLLHNASNGKVKVCSQPLGRFVPGREGSKPQVLIYYESIKDSIEDDETCWSVMAGVFVHEMFHAWNYFKAGQKSSSVLAIDEPMVEFEALYFLKRLEDFTTSLKDDVTKVRKNREERVQNKQQTIGDVAAYGFGYYLFEKLSESDSIQWIETYSKKSASIKSSELVNNVVDALIPTYPFESEDEVMEWFEEIIFDGYVTSVIVGKSATTKVYLDVLLRKLVLACIKRIGRKYFEAKELYAFAPIFEVCVPHCENLENALKQQLDELVKEGILDALPSDCYSMK